MSIQLSSLARIPAAVALCALAAPALSAQCELQKVLGKDNSPRAGTGIDAAIEGSTAVFGAWTHIIGLISPGAAYVFGQTPSGWVQQQRLVALDGRDQDEFGREVEISGNNILISASLADPNGLNSGAAYVFQNTSGKWLQAQKLVSSDNAAGDQFGYAFALDSTWALVSARYDDDKGMDSGSVYVFQNQGGTWVETQKLTASDGAAHDHFGFSVALSGTTAVIGAADTDGPQDSGSAYVFENQGGTWVETQKLTARGAQAGDQFGTSVAIEKGTIVVGAWKADGNVADTGAAYVFDDQGGTWTEIQKLTGSDSELDDFFGLDVTISGSTIAIGAYGDDDVGNNSGAAYLFTDNAGTWVESSKFAPRDVAADHEFAYKLAISGDILVSGSHHHPDLGPDSGAGYFFSLSSTGCPTLIGDNSIIHLGTGGQQNLSLNAGAAFAGQSYVLLGTASGIAPGFSAFGMHFPLNPDGYFASTVSTLGGPPLINGAGVLDGSGTASAGFALPAGLGVALAGLEIDHAFVAIDAGSTLSLVSNPEFVRLLP